MVVLGKDIKFRRSVQANCEIADICPNKDINKFNELINGNYPTAQKAAATFIVALNRAHEDYANYIDPAHEPDPVSIREIMMLDNEQFNDLFMEALKVFADDGKTTVETEPLKKTESVELEQGAE